MNFNTIFLFFLLSFSFISNGQNASINKEVLLNETTLLNHLETLSSDLYEGRRTGTKGGVKARKYIVNQFHLLDVLPFKENYEHFFSFKASGKRYEGANVLGLVKGTESPHKYIVISAHYDHEGIKKKKIYNGADDNASGISALFAFAEYFKKNPPKHSVILIAFDAEELGLKGSKHFVESASIPHHKIVVNLNMDMISRSDNDELFVVGTRYNKTLKYLVSTFKQSNKIKLTIGHDGEDGKENWTYSSDHASFHKREIPFLYFGVADHKDYHEPTDDFKNIHPEFYKDAVKTIILLFEKVDASHF
ncbi:M28 family peptidase [Jejuia spongiicola]|uniref:M28 family peptidase n=1 Tax=Jejuia spongiicola TaxID=2942207 RepID=A0ABT0Q9X3_9FLAO|nr:MULTISPECIES: M28 family peptidase [Flavobacteriaceae]MCL6293771.1 M28 family peptidase [Jejuia spongiicola]PIA78678.1 peptidase M20 [Gaetbulibacter sp. 4G1]